MSTCCVSGCKNRLSPTSELNFYRIPSGSRPFQVNRRRLWLQAIQEVNGRTLELKGNPSICGAHFKSQEASMDRYSPDFVPSVFTCAKQTPKKKVKRFYGRRKRRRRTAKTEETTPPRADSPIDFESSAFTEEKQTPSSPLVPKEGETLSKNTETESETTTNKSQTTSSPNKALTSFKVPAGIPTLDKMSPIVLLKRVFVPAGGYQCEECNQKFTSVSRLMKHRQLHEEEQSVVCEMCGTSCTSLADFTEHQCEPSFPCNMCDQSFTSSHSLKRHKLLHVRDGRKCGKCGVLFCRRHNHVSFLPLTETTTEYEEDSSTIEPQHFNYKLKPENHLAEKPSRNADLDADAQSTMAVSPGPLSHEAPSPAPSFSPEIFEPVYLKLSSVSHLPPPVPRLTRKPDTFSPTRFIQPPPPQHLQPPPSLKLFSPQYLTSALLEVRRNYEYILTKREVKKERNIVKVEPRELPLIPPYEQSVGKVKEERTAYDLEIVL